MLPNDPMILLSFINTRLRDEDSSLEDFCRRNDVDEAEITARLSAVGYRYDEAANQFK